MSTLNRKNIRRKVHRRIRKMVAGTAARPRLAVHYSNQNIYVQVIDDVAGTTLCAASTLDKEIEGKGANVAMAEKIGALIGQGMSCFEAAVAAAHLHGQAGDLAAKQFGQVSMIASDLIDALPQAFMKNSKQQRRKKTNN